MALLSVSGLVSGYKDLTVLHAIDFAIEPGQVVAIVGSNGAGKTTLLRTISGLLRPLCCDPRAPPRPTSTIGTDHALVSCAIDSLPGRAARRTLDERGRE